MRTGFRVWFLRTKSNFRCMQSWKVEGSKAWIIDGSAKRYTLKLV